MSKIEEEIVGVVAPTALATVVQAVGTAANIPGNLSLISYIVNNSN